MDEALLAAAIEAARMPDLALMQVREDIRARKVPDAVLRAMAERALACGQREARECAAAEDPAALLDGLGVPVVEDVRCRALAESGTCLVAMTEEAPDGAVSVTLYRDALAGKAAALTRAHERWGAEAPTEEELVRLTLWHELFHVRDFRQGRALSEELGAARTAGLIRRSVHIGAAAEAAAHSFAFHAVSGRWNPWKLDLHFLLAEGMLTKERLDRGLSPACGRMTGGCA